jgi:hypothetical protein
MASLGINALQAITVHKELLLWCHALVVLMNIEMAPLNANLVWQGSIVLSTPLTLLFLLTLLAQSSHCPAHLGTTVRLVNQHLFYAQMGHMAWYLDLSKPSSVLHVQLVNTAKEVLSEATVLLVFTATLGQHLSLTSLNFAHQAIIAQQVPNILHAALMEL